MDLARFKKKPLLGILRGISADCVEPVVETAAGCGLEAMEITMNTPEAARLISEAVQVSGRRLMIGAGTVLTMESLKSALDSGATFIVTPVLVDDVTAYCVKNNIPVFPGALTPSEIYQAWQAGAAMVKVFPAKVFGPEYFREVKGPLEKIGLMACAGVTADNLKDYFACGASAVSFGASVFKKEWLAKQDFKSIALAINRYIKAWQEMKPNLGTALE
jgi:2-dehydro-3-deoxyphosphogluconate aldolase/(4S)-4-hydroxy-2-oxoglutarate aldolase